MRILLSGGGTAGHINPALAIANYIKDKKPDTEILFVGNKGGMEQSLIPKAGYNIELIRVSGLKRKISVENIKTAVRLVTSFNASLQIIKRFKPDIVIGTGGYVCAPVMLAAIKLKIPTIVHEQNVFPGLTVKMVAHKADITAVSFDETEKYFKKPPKRLLLTGNPIRPDILKATKVKKDGELLVLISGGSLGAGKLNDALVELLKKEGQDYYGIIASTGERNYRAVMDRIKEEGIKLCENKKIVPYIYDMDKVLAEADLAITRSGAITVCELLAMGKPAILIPSPNVTNDHQTYNAHFMEKKGAAVVISEKDLSGEVLAGQIKTMLSDRKKLEEMSKCGKKAAITTACEVIYNAVLELTQD